MAKVQNKTVETNESVIKYLEAIADVEKRNDCYAIVELMKGQTGFEPKLWGSNIIGFGSYHYKYESGREGDAPLVAFSPRKSEITLYLSANFDKREEMLKKFGKHKSAKGCVYIKRLKDVQISILKNMVSSSVKHVKSLYK